MALETDWRGNIFCIRDRTKELFNRKQWTDVSFAIFDESGQLQKTFTAHKVILANASEVFEKMFFGSLPEDTSRNIPVNDMPSETFWAMLKYIYSDEVALDSWQNVAELYGAAKKFKLHALEKHCIECLISLLTQENALEIYEFAELHELKSLLDAALKIIISQTKAVIESPFFNKIKLSTLATIVEQETLNVSEIELFNAVESLAKRKGVVEGTRKEEKGNTEAKKPPLWNEFREIIKQIRFLSMADKAFINGPGFSDLLLPDEALSLTSCLMDPNNIEYHYPKEFIQKKRSLGSLGVCPRVFFDISIDKTPTGRMVMELRSDVMPKLVEHFRSLCTGENNIGFKNTKITTFCEDYFCATAINFTNSRKAEVHPRFEEKSQLRCTKAGILATFLTDGVLCKNNFFITFCPLNWSHSSIFGEIVEGLDVLTQIKACLPDGYTPLREILISDCGEL